MVYCFLLDLDHFHPCSYMLISDERFLESSRNELFA